MVYEDFGDFEEVDPDGELTVTANKIHVIDQDFDSDSRVYKDYGENHFDGDFVHRLEVTFTSITVEEWMLGFWAVSNVSTGWAGIFVTTSILVVATGVGEVPGIFSFVIWGFIDGFPPAFFDYSIDMSLNTRYYITIERSGTEYTVTIRTGSHEGTVVDILSVDAEVATAFQYLYSQVEMSPYG